MSILIPTLKVYNNVYSKLVSFTFNNQCDINYSSLIRPMHERTIQDFVESILHLNELSYNIRYEEGKSPHLVEFLDLVFKGKSISTIQLLKYLQCIEYNIELDTIKEGLTDEQYKKLEYDHLDNYKLLERLIEELKSTIISRLLPEYESAKWCE